MPLNTEQYRQLFVETSKLLSPEVFDKAVQNSAITRIPLDQLLTEIAFISLPQYMLMLGNYFGVPALELKVSNVDTEALHLITEEFATSNLVIAFAIQDKKLCVALTDPSDTDLIWRIGEQVHREVQPYVTTDSAIRRSLLLYGGSLKERVQRLTGQMAHSASQQEEGESITALVNGIIESAILLGASDVHIEPYDAEIILRLRVDGHLQTIATLPPALRDRIVARIKVIADLKLDEQRLPQDGRFSLEAKGQQVSVRVSLVPSMMGEKVVMRVLSKETRLFNVANLGMLEDDRAIVQKYLKKPHGMVLVTGPTNSGKTTSLYAFLQEIGLDRIDIVNISTIEDPIEYTMPRITQIQTNPEIGLSFASGLRALLRQDPDILMVGEIRDPETADFAIRAALIGRLVFSSLHTNDAPATIPRLLDMGIEPYLISSTLTLIIAQRLARKLCEYCRQSYVADKATLELLKEKCDMKSLTTVLLKMGIIRKASQDIRLYKAVGCDRCHNTGYEGRIGVFEVLEVSPTIQKAINGRSDTTTIRNAALKGGMKSMLEDGMAKAIMGHIDLEELFSVVN